MRIVRNAENKYVVIPDERYDMFMLLVSRCGDALLVEWIKQLKRRPQNFYSIGFPEYDDGKCCIGGCLIAADRINKSAQGRDLQSYMWGYSMQKLNDTYKVRFPTFVRWIVAHLKERKKTP